MLHHKKWPLLLLLAVAALAAWLMYLRWEQPPRPAPAEPLASPAPTPAPAETALPAEGSIDGRRPGVYTLLLAGRDGASGNTDTILLARLDTAEHGIDVVSLPRDTLVNLDWPVRKLNAVYAGTVNGGGVGAEGLKREVRKLCGFTPDCYAVVDLEVFIQAVDLIGGVDFELPQAMHYDDPAQDLHIHLEAGPRHLNGEEAMGLVRYRSGYLNGDLDRVAVQQRFMAAALGQLLSLGTIPKLPELVALLAEHTDTDLSASNFAWLIRQTLRCEREDIRFHTLPTGPADIAGLSYTVVEPEEWLALLNESLSPYTLPLGPENLDLVYRDAGGYHATGGVLRGPGYYY